MRNADVILAALGRSATLTRAGEPDRAVRVVLRDGDQGVKMGRGRLVGSQVTAASLASADLRRGDRLTIAGAVYEVQEAEESYTPGLRDHALRRVSGAAVVSALPGYAGAILATLGQTLQTAAGPVAAQITRGGEMLRESDWGVPVSVVRTVASVSEDVAATMRRGDPVELDGVALRVADIQRDGRGLVRLVLE